MGNSFVFASNHWKSVLTATTSSQLLLCDAAILFVRRLRLKTVPRLATFKRYLKSYLLNTAFNTDSVWPNAPLLLHYL